MAIFGLIIREIEVKVLRTTLYIPLHLHYDLQYNYHHPPL
jgi:hypothetical protein